MQKIFHILYNFKSFYFDFVLFSSSFPLCISVFLHLPKEKKTKKPERNKHLSDAQTHGHKVFMQLMFFLFFPFTYSHFTLIVCIMYMLQPDANKVHTRIQRYNIRKEIFSTILLSLKLIHFLVIIDIIFSSYFFILCYSPLVISWPLLSQDAYHFYHCFIGKK